MSFSLQDQTNPFLGAPVAPKLQKLRNGVTPPGESAAKLPGRNVMGTADTTDVSKEESEYLDHIMLGKGGAVHPHLGVFMTGPWRGKTPDQVREKLLADHRSGADRGNGPGTGVRAGGGLQSGSLSSPNEWAAIRGGNGGSGPTSGPGTSVPRVSAVPSTQSRGTTTNTGASNFNYRGVRNVRTAQPGDAPLSVDRSGDLHDTGANATEYDPRKDMNMVNIHPDNTITMGGMDKPTQNPGKNPLPAGAAMGTYIDPKYTGGVPGQIGTVSYGPRSVSGPSVIDEHGPVDTKRYAGISDPSSQHSPKSDGHY